MTKRNKDKFKRSKNDFYATPESAVLPLLPHLGHEQAAVYVEFDEPCVGDGALLRHLEKHGHSCEGASDIEPLGDFCHLDLFDTKMFCHGEMFITNPPWTREILHPLITHLSDLAPTWLLFDSDWAHTKQAIPFGERCVKIVSVGRVSWMGNGVSGFDNCSWYLFDKNHLGATRFFWRT